jgi:hypothetical protein
MGKGCELYMDHKCNTLATPGLAVVTSDSPLGS